MLLFAPCIVVACFVLLLLLVRVLYSFPSCHVQIGAWNARLGKEKRGRFCLNIFLFNSFVVFVLIFVLNVFSFV